MTGGRKTITSAAAVPIFFLCIGGLVDGAPADPAQRVPAIKNGKDPMPRPGVPSRMRIVEDLRVGGPGGPDDSLLGDARSVAVDNAGRIFVLDYKRKVIVAFDADGRFERLIGRPGQGPGELQAPMRIMVTAAGELAAEDHYAKRFTVYTPDGRYARQIPFPPVFIFSTGIDAAGRIIEYGNKQTQCSNTIGLLVENGWLREGHSV